MLAEVGAWGVNLHDNDLVPIDATPAERDRIVSEFKKACEREWDRGSHGDREFCSTTRIPGRRIHRERPAGCVPTLFRKRCKPWTCGAELGAKIFVRRGGREGTETDACRRDGCGCAALTPSGELSLRVLDGPGYGFKFALEAKPNEPRGDIYMLD